MKNPRILLDEIIISDEPGFACSKSKLVENGLIHLRPFNLTNDGELSLDQIYRVPPEEAPNGKRILKEGDILFNNTNSVELVGKAALVERTIEAGFSNHLTRLRFDQTKILPHLAAYWLRRKRETGFFSAHATRWVSQAAFKSSELRRMKISLPPLEEQRRIVDLLSRAEGIVRLRREAQKKAAELIPALFLDMFGDPATNPKGWLVVQLGELITDGPQNGLYKHSSLYGEGTPILRIDSFYDGRVKNLQGLKRVSITQEEVHKYRLHEKDIVINRVNSVEYIGKSALIPLLLEDTVFESNMMRFSIDCKRCLPKYLIEFLQTACSKTQILAKAKHAINQSSINQQDVRSIALPIPPIDAQSEFAKQVEGVCSIQSQQVDALKQAEATFQALLAHCFGIPPA